MASPESPLIPHLRPTETSSQLIVNGKPFLMLPGELQNSSLSSSEYMSTAWPKLKAMNINTALGSVTWEMIEPREDVFDFDELDRIILDARRFGIKLVLLWFGSLKNAMSTYAPPWVKRDAERFPRAWIRRKGSSEGHLSMVEVLSPFHEACWKADAKAFGTLMRHIKKFDQVHETVIMVQVENEPGLLGDSRDRSEAAEAAFASPLSSGLASRLAEPDLHPTFRQRFPDFKSSRNATWTGIFGKTVHADEMFMADAISKYIGHVAEAGKREYPIPHYANVWINFDDAAVLDLSSISEGTRKTVVSGGTKAGDYPSGGPCPHALDIWRYNAPALDFFGPDIYHHGYSWVCEQYRYKNQPLFIPEQKREEEGLLRAWVAYGTHGALGASPFGVDTADPATSPITKVFGLLGSVQNVILEAQAKNLDNTFGFFFDKFEKTPDAKWVKIFGGYELLIQRSFVFGKPGTGGGMIIHKGDGRFLLIGYGFQVTFKSTKPTSAFTGILQFVEKVVQEDGTLVDGRYLNGDETRSGAFVIMPNDDPDYGNFSIAVTIPARTYVAECEAYSIG